MNVQYVSISPGEPFITCGMDDDVSYPSPDQLGIEPALRDSLQAWITKFWSCGGGPSSLGTFEHTYLVEGWTLARQLARELGPSPVVYWCSTPALDAPHP